MGLRSYHIIDFADLHKVDNDLIGKKAHQLSELKYLGIEIPGGFVIMPSFFKEFLDKTGISEDLKKVERMKHPALKDSYAALYEPVQRKIMLTHIPRHLTSELHDFYRKLAGAFKELSLNIYSSAKENRSFVFKNVKGDANLILKIKTLLTHYLDQPFSVVVQKNVLLDKKTIATNHPSISDQNLLKLVRKIQKHFYFPQELDYVIEKGRIYITDVRPFTGIVLRNEKKKKILVKGTTVNPGIVTGSVKILREQDLSQIKSGEIIVLSELSKTLYEKIKKAKAIVADCVLFNDHDKAVYRKFIQIPTIQNARNAAKILQNGNIVTVNGITGEIYSGGII